MPVFDTIRQFVEHGDLEQALDQFIRVQTTEDPSTLRLLRVLKARFNAMQQKERKGLVDTEEAQKEFNFIADALLGIADDLESGNKPSLNLEDPSASSNRIGWLIGGGILLLLAAIAFILTRQNNEPRVLQVLQPPATATSEKECPDFKEKGFRVLLIPFLNLRNDAGSKPELGLQERIRALTRKNNVDSDVEVFPGKQFEKSTPDIQDATQIGKKCAADMVVWGQYEMVGSDIQVDVQYVFTKSPNFPPGEVSDTFKSLSELKANKMKFTSLEEAVFSLCSMMALHEGNTELAEKWLNKIPDPAPELQKIRKMLQRHK